MSRAFAVMFLAAACGSRPTTPAATTPAPPPGAETPAAAPAPSEPAPAASVAMTTNPSFASLNLDFEQGDGTAGWSVDAPGSGATADATVKHGGARSLRLTSERAKRANAELEAPVTDVRGRRVKVTGWVKTRDVSDGWAGMWLRAEGTHDGAAFEDLRRRSRRGTNDWSLLEVTLVVPHEVERMTIGVTVVGGGTAWFDDLAIAVDDERPETIEQLTLL